MGARVVIGANYGDEGKGLVTDYLASQGGEVVVRFNGGAQAGHTVLTPEGVRHVFSHFGSGSLLGLPTFWSQFCVVNPFAFVQEYGELLALGCVPTFHAHPDCIVTTPWDMDANQERELSRGVLKHGSCGMGFFETIQRDQRLHLDMAMVWQGGAMLKNTVSNIRRNYGRNDTDDLKTELNFLKDCVVLANKSQPACMNSFADPIFEGAQGLMIGQENMIDYPYLSPSYCGMKNVRQLVYEGGLEISDVYYVSRTYLTRHGFGPLPQQASWSYPDETNIENDWQDGLRFASLEPAQLQRRIHADYEKPKLILTHCNEHEAVVHSELEAWGQTRGEVVKKPGRKVA